MRKSADPLLTYKQKRDFTLTPEPSSGVSPKTSVLSFVVQKHASRSLHYDFRLELDGTLKSWAVPKGPSLDPSQKRLAIQVEDHPLQYAGFEGVIPPRQYGAGKVIIWDHGTWEPFGDPREGLAAGQLKFRLHGGKLRGSWALVRMRRKPEERQESWLLIKERDAQALPSTGSGIDEEQPDPAATSSDAPVLPAGAKLGSLPASLSPQLAALVDHVPASGNWIYEIKFDGYRILARIDNGDVQLFTRNGHNWTVKMPGLAASIAGMNLASGWLDGEIVVLGEAGLPDFGALQNSLDASRTADISYFVFDIPFYGGFDLRGTTLDDRRLLLSNLIRRSTSDHIRFSEDFAADGKDILSSACRMGLEGVIGKRRDSPYYSGRSASWIKLKCAQRQEFVVVGYSGSSGRIEGIGALLLGVYDDAGKLRYVGRVGTGFNSRNLGMLKEKLTQRAIKGTPLFEKPGDAVGNWVEPDLVAEVSFAGWTRDDRVRQAVFHGLRSDKPAASITREKVQRDLPSEASTHEAPGTKKKSELSESAMSQISNPDRVIDVTTGLKKLDLAAYYDRAAQWILPHLVNRPVSLLRAPAGIEGEHFFQKHSGTLKIHGLKNLDPALDPGHPALMEIDSRQALLGAVQMNAIEFHTWNASVNHIDKPDRIVFDLDPGEGLAWTRLLEAADLTRVLLDELGLQSFLKTSGGNGLHVVVPLTPEDDWQTVKEFSKLVVQHLAAVVPSRFVSLSGSRNRVGKVFADYLRNGRGATTVAAFSARARPGLGVSMPCSWDELSALTGGAQWTITNAPDRWESRGDPWKNYLMTKQTLGKAAEKIGLHR